MSVLVTGLSGFVGAHCAQQLPVVDLADGSGRVGPRDAERVRREWAEQFGEAGFKREVSGCVDQAWSLWQRGPRGLEAALADGPSAGGTEIPEGFAAT